MTDKNDKLISNLVDMLFVAKKVIEYLPPLPDSLRKSHLQVLQVIDKLNQEQLEARVTSISKTLKITSPNITKLINELEEMNLVVKLRSIEDKRVVLVQTTSAGEKILHHYVKDYHQYLNKVIENIGVERCELTIETVNQLAHEMQKISKEFKGD